jgi:hypothetical protein
VKTHPEIPFGDYCYTYGPSGRKMCPHFTSITVNEVSLPYCNHLKMGSIPNDLTENEYSKLKAVFGSDSNGVLNETPETALFLLFDACKECGVHGDRDGYNWETQNYPASYPHHIFCFLVTTKEKSFYVQFKISKTGTVGHSTQLLLSSLLKFKNAVKPFVPLSMTYEGVRNSKGHFSTILKGHTVVFETFNQGNGKGLVTYCADILRTL